MNQFLTVGQVAQTFQVHIDTVRIWLRTGRIQGIKIGKSWRIPATEIQRLSTESTKTQY